MLIELDGRVVEYRFARRRRRTIGITVDAAGLRVAAPLRAPWRDIEAFLREKDRWILAKLEQWAAAPRGPVLHCTTGETVPVLGVPLCLDVRRGRRAVREEDARLVVSVPKGARPARALLAWLKEKALALFAPRCAHYAALLALPVPGVALSNARTQWGVCREDGTIRLSWRLVHLAPALVDYVVAHEVAHLAEMNHSRRFWAIVARLYPRWREARERLELAAAALPQLKGER